jgi:FlaA1/EpsC-like NDP-sugar epimerase
MVRYFMTIPEAVQLVLQAAVVGRGAAVLMLDMGEPVRIVDLARDLIELSGLQVGRDITITFSGLRPGEKLFEEMFKPNEEQCRTEHEKIFIAPNASQDIPSELDAIVDTLIRAALNNNGAAVISLLSELLPEYQPWPSHYAVTNHQDASTALPQTDAVAPMTKQTVVPATLTFNSAIGD